MTNPTFDNIDYGVPGKAIGRSGSVNYTFPYSGPVPVMPTDLAASEARVVAAIADVKTAVLAAVAALPQSATPDATPSVTAAQGAILSAVAAIPKPVDPTPAIAAVQTSIAALPKPIDATPAVTSAQTAILTQMAKVLAALAAPAPGSLGSVALTSTGGTGGSLLTLWLPGNASDTPPTVTVNGAAQVPVTVSGFGVS